LLSLGGGELTEPVQVATRLRARERVVVHVDSPAVRWTGTLALLIAASWLVALLARSHGQRSDRMLRAGPDVADHHASPTGRPVAGLGAGRRDGWRSGGPVRQAVQRTHNFGITTEIVAEHEPDDAQLAELTDVLLASHKGARTERGFSMILDGALTARYPGILLIIARDKNGCVQGFHRYALAGGGSDVTIDVPWRRRGAPNGIDERLSVDMITAMRQAGAQRLSLAFAAFPEIFNDKERGALSSFFYTAIHLGDPLITAESLYRYLRKFHALGDRRYVLLSFGQVLHLLAVLLSLEFMPRRRQLPSVTASVSG
jgi:hypothetical protein